MKKISLGLFLCMFALAVSAQNYVDLGLPSGILWADANEPGVYTFDESVTAFRGDEMPGMYEFKELEKECVWHWNDSGYTVIGPNGDSIVLPMVKTKWCTGVFEEKTSGLYWSAEAFNELEGWGLYFSKDMISTQMSFARCQGLPVRKIKHPARVLHRPDYELIQSVGKTAYDQLVKRFYAQDTTLTMSEMNTIYYGSAFYNRLSTAVGARSVNEMFEKGAPMGDIMAFSMGYLMACPVDLEMLMYMAAIAEMNSNTAEVYKYYWMVSSLADAILSTGDGESDSTAFHVVTVADEYTIMRYLLQVQPDMQTLTSSMCDMFDATTQSGRKIKLYFDVQLILALENRMFSNDKNEPFHFTYEELTGNSEPVAGLNMGSKEEKVDVIEIDDSVDEGEEAQVPPLMDEDGNYLILPVMPRFPGGRDSLFTFLSANVKYPKELANAHISGKVVVQFVVDTDGTITDVVVVRSSGEPLLDEEAVRVVKMMPKWTPGMNEGEPVRVKYTIPVNFKLQDENPKE